MAQTMAAVLAALNIGGEVVFRNRQVHLDGRAILAGSDFDGRQVLDLDGQVDQIGILPIPVRLQLDDGRLLVRSLMNFRRRTIDIVADDSARPFTTICGV